MQRARVRGGRELSELAIVDRAEFARRVRDGIRFLHRRAAPFAAHTTMSGTMAAAANVHVCASSRSPARPSSRAIGKEKQMRRDRNWPWHVGADIRRVEPGRSERENGLNEKNMESNADVTVPTSSYSHKPAISLSRYSASRRRRADGHDYHTYQMYRNVLKTCNLTIPACPGNARQNCRDKMLKSTAISFYCILLYSTNAQDFYHLSYKYISVAASPPNRLNEIRRDDDGKTHWMNDQDFSAATLSYAYATILTTGTIRSRRCGDFSDYTISARKIEERRLWKYEKCTRPSENRANWDNER